MKRKIEAGAIIISLDDEEVKQLCRPGAGADTCIWLVMGTEGWECLYFCRDAPNLEGETLRQRWETGQTVAKRDRCPELEAMEKDVSVGIDKFHAHLDVCNQCRNHPFDLCPTGAQLLRAAAER